MISLIKKRMSHIWRGLQSNKELSTPRAAPAIRVGRGGASFFLMAGRVSALSFFAPVGHCSGNSEIRLRRFFMNRFPVEGKMRNWPENRGKLNFSCGKREKKRKNRVLQYNLLEFLNKKFPGCPLTGIMTPYSQSQPLSFGGHNPAFFHWILYNDSSGPHKKNSSLARRAGQLRPDKKPGIVPLGRLRKAVMPMRQFLRDVLAAFAAGVLVALVLRFLNRWH